MDAQLLWVDDEIESLQPHILFLKQKGYHVEPCTNGEDALARVNESDFDLIFLDENMPGLSGLEVLRGIKALRPHVPVVMITKSEEEGLMEDAIGSQIADYLIKPVNPNQILHSVKKLLQGKELVGQKANEGYQQDFRQIAMAFFDDLDAAAWAELYRKLVYWDIALEASADTSMRDVLNSQLAEANVEFGKFVARNYEDWVAATPGERPLLSPDILPQKVFPRVKAGEKPVFLFVLDCLRYDQWQAFSGILADDYRVVEEEMGFSLLPTATQYARNALFAGLFPKDIYAQHPDWWVFDDEDEGKNLFEQDLFVAAVKRHGLDIRTSYTKLITAEHAKAFEGNWKNLLQNDLNAVVVNFIDMLAHSRADLNVIRELSPDEAALRALACNWLEHSALLRVLKQLKEEDVTVILTTDHGVTRVQKPVVIKAERAASNNLRYKHGRNLGYDEKAKYIYGVRKPERIGLPSATVSGSYAFLQQDYFFVYPNQQHKFAAKYADTLQHGGISLAEMLVPYVVLQPK